MDLSHQHSQPPRPKSRHKRNRSTGSNNSSFSSLFQKTLNPAHHLRHRIVKKAASVVDTYVNDLTSRAPYLLSCDAQNGFDEGKTQPVGIPLLDRDELRIEKLLGEGGFCQVWEVSGVLLKDDGAGDTDTARQSLANSSAPLVVKQLRKRLTKNPPQFTLAAADLVVEAQYLSRLCHPHIIPVRGMTRGGINAMQEGGKFDAYFLVLDKLETTLDQRIQAWQRGLEIPATYDQKLTYALQIAQALQYLHQRRILFRDVKPHNIGFRADNGQLQLFDFGLCRELPPPRERLAEEEKVEEEEEEQYSEGEEVEEEEDDVDLDDYYHMTKVGTRRYCAVEMYISGLYNEKVDVYSWAMTTYEMISLCKPFASLTDADHQEYVCAQGKRPNTKAFLQQCEQPPRGQRNPLLALVREAWEQYVRDRIDMACVVERMEDIIAERNLQQKEQSDSSFTSTEKEKELAGSVVSATTVTVTESDHDGEFESPLHAHSSRTATGSDTPIHDDDARREEEVISNDSDDGEGEDDASVHSLKVVDIGIPGSRHSIISAPSTTSGSEQSARWDDSINTNEVGLAADASLSTIVFDELLRPRNRGIGLGMALADTSVSNSSAASGKGSLTAHPLTAAAALTATAALTAAAALTPPALAGNPPKSPSGNVTTTIDDYNPNNIMPPTTTLTRIVSMDLDESDTHDEEQASEKQHNENKKSESVEAA